MHHPSFPRPAHRRHGLLSAAGAIFAAGFATGAMLRPSLPLPKAGAVDKAFAAAPNSEPLPAPRSNAPRLDVQPVYPAEVVRVIDGDTFEARVRVWPGLNVDTKVRLRDIDAPELHARCADELAKAQAARGALESMLAAGGVTVARVGLDKYGGRVDAVVATRATADVSRALLDGGFARSYGGGRRDSWC